MGRAAEPYLSFGAEGDFEGDVPVTRISAMFSGGYTTRWQYGEHGWSRPYSFAETGKDFQPGNILLLRVETRDAGYRDPAGNPVPETVLAGKGDAVLVHGDRAIEVSWAKPFRGSALRLSTKDGHEVSVPAGRTWIELVPSDGGGSPWASSARRGCDAGTALLRASDDTRAASLAMMGVCRQHRLCPTRSPCDWSCPRAGPRSAS